MRLIDIDIETIAPRLAAVSAGLATELLLDLGLKPVARELHDAETLEQARAAWEARGYHTRVGAEVREDPFSAAMVSESAAEHTIRPLETHPVIERLVALGGPLARRVLLDPRSPVYKALCERWGADQAPLASLQPQTPEALLRRRRALYVSRDPAQAEAAREVDRMAADDARPGGPADAADRALDAQARELGRLLGYPACCVDAYLSLPRRFPNRVVFEAAKARTRRAPSPLLNNLSLERFVWIAHFPCRFDCPRSIALARAAHDALAPREPELVAALDAVLALPRLYWTDAEQAVLLGARREGAELRFDRALALDALWPPPHRDAQPSGPWDALDGQTRLDATRSGPLLVPFGLQR